MLYIIITFNIIVIKIQLLYIWLFLLKYENIDNIINIVATIIMSKSFVIGNKSIYIRPIIYMIMFIIRIYMLIDA